MTQATSGPSAMNVAARADGMASSDITTGAAGPTSARGALQTSGPSSKPALVSPATRKAARIRSERHGRDEVCLVDPTAGQALRLPGAGGEAEDVPDGHVEPELGADARLELRQLRVVERAPVVDVGGPRDPVEKDRQGRRTAVHVHYGEAVFRVEDAVVAPDLGDLRVAAQGHAPLNERVPNDVDHRKVGESADVERPSPASIAARGAARDVEP